MAGVISEATPPHHLDPSSRDARYGRPPAMRIAQYLVDLHDAGAVFNFCGCLLFQLQLSAKLREHLAAVAAAPSSSQPVVFEAQFDRLAKTPGYQRSACADNLSIFHGREVRQAAGAKGGQGCVLQLCLAGDDADPEGWTRAEIADYNGWGHDGGRPWRRGPQLEQEGFREYRQKFGGQAYGLHHRFYLHLDRRGQIWLAAEDGCEGEPVAA